MRTSSTLTRTHQSLRRHRQTIPTHVPRPRHTRAKPNAKADRADITAPIAQPPLEVVPVAIATAQHRLAVCRVELPTEAPTSVSKLCYAYEQ